MPHLSPKDLSKFTFEELEKVINKAGEYQELADMLLVHPAVKYIEEETKGMDSVRP